MAWSSHMIHLDKVLQRVQDAHLTLNVKKCVFANAEVDFLGHHVGRGIMSPRSQKVEVMLNFPRPNNKKQLQSLHGLASYYRRYIPHFAELAAPWNELLKKGIKFVWNESAERSFIDLKSRLASKPILTPPDYNRPFFVAVDASQVCIGACLFQNYEDVEHTVCFFSRKLRPHESRYSTVEKEALALVTAVRTFSVYFGTTPVVVYTDHSPLTFINSMVNSNDKILRWSLELQKYTLDIQHRPGRDNLLPDLLSLPALASVALGVV